MTRMKTHMSHLMRAHSADVLDADVGSVAAYMYMRMCRFAYMEGKKGRAVKHRVGGVGVATFPSPARVRADQLAQFEYHNMDKEKKIWSDGCYAEVLPEGEAGPAGFKHVGKVSDTEAWVSIGLLVAWKKGQLAPQINLQEGDDNGFLGFYSETAFVLWRDASPAGVQEMAQLVVWVADPSGNLLKRAITMPIPLAC